MLTNLPLQPAIVFLQIPRNVTYRCGNNHNADVCPFRDKECFYCKNKGHTSKKCHKKKANAKSTPNNSAVNQLNSETLNFSLDVDSADGEHDDPILQLYKVSVSKEGKTCRGEPPLLIDVTINQVPIKIELDRGAAVSVMSKDILHSIMNENVPLHPTAQQLLTYSGEIIKPEGIIKVEVTHGNQKKVLPLIITPNNGPTLFGGNWLRHLVLDWKGLFQINNVGTETNIDSEVDAVLKEFEEV